MNGQEAQKQFKISECVSCKELAELVCCWPNTEYGKPPYNWHPFCGGCADNLFERVKNSDMYINLPL